MKSTLCLLALAGLATTAHAQTLLYQWTFNGGTGTPDVSAGGGNLSINPVSGAGSNLGYNSSGGPGLAGANGALTVSGGGYNSGNTSVASASDLTGLGTLSQISVGLWFNLGSGAGGQFPRFAMFGAANTYDAGGKPAAANALNGIGASINGWSAGPAFPATTLQNGVGNAAASANPQFGPVSIAANTWYYELFTYDGTQAANNFSTYVGSDPSSLTLVQTATANLGSINFGSSATVLLGNDNAPGATRALSSGSLANVEIWSGIMPAPEPATVAMLGFGSLVGILAFRRRRRFFSLAPPRGDGRGEGCD